MSVLEWWRGLGTSDRLALLVFLAAAAALLVLQPAHATEHASRGSTQSTPAPKFPALKPVGERSQYHLNVMVPVLLSDESRISIAVRKGVQCPGGLGALTKPPPIYGPGPRIGLLGSAKLAAGSLKRRGKNLSPAVLRAWTAFGAQGINATVAICTYEWESNDAVKGKTLRGSVVVGGLPARGARFPAVPAARRAFAFTICDWLAKPCQTQGHVTSR